MNRRFGGFEQAWLSEILPWDEAYFDDKDGIYGAGRLGDANPESMVETELPDNARIVFTPGQRTPWTPGFAEQHPWAARYEE